MDVNRIKVGTRVKILKKCCGPYLDGNEIGTICELSTEAGGFYWFSPDKPNKRAAELEPWEDGYRRICISNDITNFKILKY